MKNSNINKKYIIIFHRLIFFIILNLIFFSSGVSQTIPPVAEKIPKIDTIHGDIVIDNYFWLRENESPKVMDYLIAENEYTSTMMKHTEEFQTKLYEEMISKIQETDLSVPEKIDKYYYYTRTEEGKQYPIYCRKKGSLEHDEEILLDQNVLAVPYKYFEIGAFEVSPDHSLLAYSVDTTGSERFVLYIKDLVTGELYNERLSNTGYSIAWSNDNKTLFYTTLDNAKRPDKLYRHILSNDQTQDEMVYHEPDDLFWLGISRTKDGKYLLMDMGSHTTTETHYLRADKPNEKFRLLYPRMQDIEYYVEHHGETFLILTNENAKNFRLIQVSESDPDKTNWIELIPHRDYAKIDGFDVFRDFFVVSERKNGLEQIRVTKINGALTHYVEFPEPTYTFWFSANKDYDSKQLRFTYMSLVTPKSVFDYNMETKERELKKQYKVLGGYEPEQYESQRIYAIAHDSTRIPISIVYKKGMTKNGTNPLFLTGYGAYGDSFDPYFSSNRLSLLDRGFIYAIAHIRGGGEMGRYWHEQGKMLNKKNTFTDFIACAENLIEQNYTSKEKLVISGGSAGGLLVGAVVNMRPELFHIVVADVPFVDLINTMFDATLPLTVLEYEEWGNPNEEQYYRYMKSYSPYDNVIAQNYPNMLITAGLNDTRVMYWEGAKWTAKLRALKTDENILLLKTNMGTGHLGASGRYDFLKEIAFEYTFILDILGIKD
ncbi:MAG: S9 family peptidase [bacterium]